MLLPLLLRELSRATVERAAYEEAMRQPGKKGDTVSDAATTMIPSKEHPSDSRALALAPAPDRKANDDA